MKYYINVSIELMHKNALYGKRKKYVERYKEEQGNA